MTSMQIGDSQTERPPTPYNEIIQQLTQLNRRLDNIGERTEELEDKFCPPSSLHQQGSDVNEQSREPAGGNLHAVLDAQLQYAHQKLCAIEDNVLRVCETYER